MTSTADLIDQAVKRALEATEDATVTISREEFYALRSQCTYVNAEYPGYHLLAGRKAVVA